MALAASGEWLGSGCGVGNAACDDLRPPRRVGAAGTTAACGCKAAAAADLPTWTTGCLAATAVATATGGAARGLGASTGFFAAGAATGLVTLLANAGAGAGAAALPADLGMGLASAVLAGAPALEGEATKVGVAGLATLFAGLAGAGLLATSTLAGVLAFGATADLETAGALSTETAFLTVVVVFSAAFFTVSLLWRLAGLGVTGSSAFAALAPVRGFETLGVIPGLDPVGVPETSTNVSAVTATPLTGSACCPTERPGNSPNPCKSETNNMANARWSVNEAPHYVRHWSRPCTRMSRGKSMPMNTILLRRCSPGAHSGPRSLPMSWCTPWKMTLRSVPCMFSTPL